jgi:hypothetical protein
MRVWWNDGELRGARRMTAIIVAFAVLSAPVVAWGLYRGVVGWDILLYPVAGYAIGRASK